MPVEDVEIPALLGTIMSTKIPEDFLLAAQELETILRSLYFKRSGFHQSSCESQSHPSPFCHALWVLTLQTISCGLSLANHVNVSAILPKPIE